MTFLKTTWRAAARPLSWAFAGIRVIAHLLGLAVIAAGIVGLLYTGSVSDWAANRILANATPSSSREMPPTPFALPYASGDIQVLGGQGLGLSCSVRPVLESLAFERRPDEASVSLQMRQACAFHDYCYRHGAATYGYGQADCDYLLLEHAYKLCKFIAAERDVDCISQSRKVVLGVRLGGSAHFKRSDHLPGTLADGDSSQTCYHAEPKVTDDDCTSSYFEFDPYPTRSSEFISYRVADAPTQWVDDGVAKALYAFRIRPSGSTVTVVGWKDDGLVRCVRYGTPGQFGFLNAPPQVAAIKNAQGTPEDWLVWWQRDSLEQTSGQLATLPAGRAGLVEWQAVFHGAFQYDDCSERGQKLDPGDNHAASLSGRFTLGKEDERNPKFSELHPVLGEPVSQLRLIALQTHTCVPEGSTEVGGRNVPCYLDISIDPGGYQPERGPEPNVARDSLNDGGCASDDDRYRNFAAAPITLGGTGAESIGWLKRGRDKIGTEYQTTAVFRRFQTVGVPPNSTGRSAVPVLLTEFDEGAEPIFVMARGSITPQLVSIRADTRQHVAKLSYWQLPPPSVKSQPEITPPCSTHVRVSDGGVVTAKRSELTCDSPLDSSWVVRPPVVVAEGEDARLVFSRFVAHPGKFDDTKGVEAISLEVATATIARGTCRIAISEAPYALGTFTPSGRAGDDNESWKTILARLRSRPLLIADVNRDGRLDAVLPDPEDPRKSCVFVYPASSAESTGELATTLSKPECARP